MVGDVFHHICNVCRIDQGDRFEALWGDGVAYLCELTSRGKKQALAKIIGQRVIEPLPKPHLILALSIPKFQKLDLIVEKSVELGVQAIKPFVSEFSFARELSPNLSDRCSRARRIIESATEQSGRGDLMQVMEPSTFDEVFEDFNRTPGRLGLFLYEGQGQLSLKDHLQSVKTKSSVSEVWFFVGSEGGFSESEVAKFERAGLPPLTLGGQILRVETACLAATAILKYEFDLMRKG